MSKSRLLFEAENIQYHQQCALTTLGIIQGKLDEELMSIESSGALVSVGLLQDLASAVYITFIMLRDLNEKLREVVDEEYKNRKKGE